MARQGTEADNDLTVPSLADYAAEESRRHRATAELQLPGGSDGSETAKGPASTIPPGSRNATGALTDELREGLWAAIVSFVFVSRPADGGAATTTDRSHVAPGADAWAGGPGARPTVHLVWSRKPIGGDASDVPDDVADLIEEWFSIATTGDVYALVETVLASLPEHEQINFVNACNLVLERGLSDHRFVGRRLMPIASKSDVATIERALVSARAKHLSETERHLLAALDHLATKPEADAAGAVHEAIRAVQATAFALTKERPLDLDDALDTLEERGHIDAPLKARHGGLFSWVAQNGRKPRAEDARLILVTCAGFITHLSAQI